MPRCPFDAVEYARLQDKIAEESDKLVEETKKEVNALLRKRSCLVYKTMSNAPWVQDMVVLFRDLASNVPDEKLISSLMRRLFVEYSPEDVRKMMDAVIEDAFKSVFDSHINGF